MWSGWVQGNSNGPLVPMVRLVPMEKHPTSKNYQKIVLAYRKEDIHMSCCCLLVNQNKQNEHDSDALPFNFNVRTMFVILAAP